MMNSNERGSIWLYHETYGMKKLLWIGGSYETAALKFECQQGATREKHINATVGMYEVMGNTNVAIYK